MTTSDFRTTSARMCGLWKGGSGQSHRSCSGSYTGRLEQEDATGRFHASLAFRREIFDRIGGWPLTKRGDFDKGRTPSPRKRRRTCAGMPIC
ncbi:MAG: hypothetical protein ACK5L2_08890 [Planctomyces sp.]